MASLPGRMLALRAHWHALRPDRPDSASLSECIRLAHTLAGSAGTFGLTALGLSARRLEQLLLGPLDPERIEHALAALEAAAHPTNHPQPTGSDAAPAKPGREAEGTIYVVDDDALLAQRIAAELTHARLPARACTTLPEFAAGCAHQRPAAVVMDLGFAEGQHAGADAIHELSARGLPPPPVIFVSGRTDLAARLAAARAGGRYYLTKPVDVEQLKRLLASLLEDTPKTPYRVLVLDDDDSSARYHANLLSAAGMQTEVLTNPLQTLEWLEQFQPDLLLLDLHMPGASGDEIALVVRQDHRYTQMPIVLLSADGDMRRQLHAVSHGGDHFLTKPVAPEYLVGLIGARIRWARELNELHSDLLRTLHELEYQKLALDQHAIVSIADTSGAITYANAKFCEVSGYRLDELLGHNHRLLKSGEHGPEFYREMWSRISTGRAWHGIICNTTKAGQRYWVDSTIVPFLDRSGLPYQYISIRTDITEEKHVEQQLLRSKEEAERANRAKSDFLSRMSHELRTPMNAILGFAQLMQDDPAHPLAPLHQDGVDEILRAGNHLLELINEVLDLARIEAGRLELALEPVDLRDTAATCLRLVEPIARGHRVLLVNDLPADAPLWLQADRTRLRQVLLNLLSNGVKYNRAGGEVRLHCELRGDRARVEVRDTGQGIPAGRLPELFEPFNRIGQEHGPLEGTGIGLTISKRLVELMGGAIGADSTPGQGSVFWFDLARVGTPAALPAPEPQGAPLRARATPAQRTVIYVEDNAANLRLMENILARRPGVRLLAVTQAEHFLPLLEHERPDLVLMDLHLPGMSGYDLLKAFLAGPHRAVPVVAVTASAAAGDIERGRAAGFAEYVTKPVELEPFLRLLDRLLTADPGHSTAPSPAPLRQSGESV